MLAVATAAPSPRDAGALRFDLALHRFTPLRCPRVRRRCHASPQSMARVCAADLWNALCRYEGAVPGRSGCDALPLPLGGKYAKRRYRILDPRDCAGVPSFARACCK